MFIVASGNKVSYLISKVPESSARTDLDGSALFVGNV